MKFELNKTTTALLIGVVGIGCAALFLFIENRRIDADLTQIQQQLQILQSQLPTASTSIAGSSAVCDSEFPSGFYRLSTSTTYGPTPSGSYDIYHVSILLSEWNVNVGLRLNRFAVPTDFYFDYDSDGRIDTAIAARFVREIPVAGNTIADRMLADSRVHQNLYGVFSCEWRNAEFTSTEDMNSTVTDSPNMLWELVLEQSERIVEWIDEV